MKFYLPILFFLLSVSLLAQDKLKEAPLDKKLKEVVVTAQYAPQGERQAIYRVRTISKSTILRRAATNLRELLLTENTLDLSQKSVFGSSIQLQGVSKENIKILIDGVPVIGRLNGIIDLSQIDLIDVERVEIIEGPVSVFYGTDAMGGIINLITSHSTINKFLDAQASLMYESIGASSLHVGFGKKWGSFKAKINGGFYSFDGLATHPTERHLNWEKKNRTFAAFDLSRQIKNLSARYTSRWSSETLYSLGEPTKRGITDKDYYTQRLDNALFLSGELAQKFYLNTVAAHQDYKRFHDTWKVANDESRALSTIDTRDLNKTHYTHTEVKSSIGTKNDRQPWKYLVGIDANREYAQGQRIKNGQQSVLDLAGFSSLNYSYKQFLQFQPGIRYTWNSSFGSLLSPAINIKITPTSRHIIRLAYARGFRAPSLKELYLDFHISAGPTTYIISGNENLDVEKSHSFSLNYIFNVPQARWNTLVLETSLFYNNIDNLISLSEFKNNQRHYININSFKSTGGKWGLTLAPNSNVVLKTTFGLVGRVSSIAEIYNKKNFLFTPDWASALTYTFPKLKLSIHLNHKYSGASKGYFYDTRSKELKETTRPSYHNLNASITKNLLENRWHISIGAKNILDVKDIITSNALGEVHSRDLTLWGRSYFIKVNYNL